MGGKIIYLEDEPYLLTIPTGDESDKNSDWDMLVMATGGDDNVMHWSGIRTWVIDKSAEAAAPNCRAFRGFDWEGAWGYNWSNMRGSTTGFRPVLIPLNTTTLEIDTAVFKHISDGSLIQTGALYMGNKPVKIPAKPFKNGDIVKYVNNADLSIKDSDRNVITWIVVGNKLIADRTLLSNISYDDMADTGLV